MMFSGVLRNAAALASIVSGAAVPASAPSIDALAAATGLSGFTHLRIEGLTDTIWEFPVVSGPRNITTVSGGTHLCDGTNDGANPTPGNTPTDALDAAAKLGHFAYDGTFSSSFDDYFITSIGSSTQTASQFWGLLVNYQFTPVGGCQFETKDGDEVLWAFDAFNKQYFLKATPARVVVAPGQTSYSVTVTDGSTGVAIAGASFAGVLTDAAGVATVPVDATKAKAPSVQLYKATRADSIRSNVVRVVLT